MSRQGPGDRLQRYCSHICRQRRRRSCICRRHIEYPSSYWSKESQSGAAILTGQWYLRFIRANAVYKNLDSRARYITIRYAKGRGDIICACDGLIPSENTVREIALVARQSLGKIGGILIAMQFRPAECTLASVNSHWRCDAFAFFSSGTAGIQSHGKQD